MTWRDWNYAALRAANDARAVRRNRIGRRLWNRGVGRLTRKLFR